MWEKDKVKFIALPVPRLQVVTPPNCSRCQHETQTLDLNLEKRQVSPPDTSRVTQPDTCWSYLLTSRLAPTYSSPTWLMVITDCIENTDLWVSSFMYHSSRVRKLANCNAENPFKVDRNLMSATVLWLGILKTNSLWKLPLDLEQQRKTLWRKIWHRSITSPFVFCVVIIFVL